MKGTRPQKLPPPSKPKGVDGRVCAEPSCTTRLSQYNATDRCWHHTEASYPTFRGKRFTEPGGA
ncbi:MAG: hypothetical protein WD556_04750 [Actinomycetota bacterium]